MSPEVQSLLPLLCTSGAVGLIAFGIYVGCKELHKKAPADQSRSERIPSTPSGKSDQSMGPPIETVYKNIPSDGHSGTRHGNRQRP